MAYEALQKQLQLKKSQKLKPFYKNLIPPLQICLISKIYHGRLFFEEYDTELFIHHLSFVSGIYFMSLSSYYKPRQLHFILCYCLVPVSKSGLSQSSLLWAAGGGIT